MPTSESQPGLRGGAADRPLAATRGVPALLRREGPWLAAAVATVAVVWGAALLHEPRHFFSGDTEQAYYGWWVAVGDALRHGHLALLDPNQLPYGNHVLDGQLGLYNPLIAVVGLGATVAPQVVFYATAVKWVVGFVGVIGCYGVVRNYRVEPPLAAAAAVAVALCGFTYGLSGARWFDGQLGVALLPWAWWAVRRLCQGRSPFPALVLCFLIVTIGYVYPTLYLGGVLLVCALEALLCRRWRALLKVVIVGVFCGLIAVLVYLPGMMTSGMTVRAGHGIVWDGANRLAWWQVPLLWQPVGRTDPPLFGFQSWSPVQYVVWWLPLLLFVDPMAARRRWRGLMPLAVGALLWALWSVGPAQVGPLRWPTRSLEAMTLLMAVFVVVAVSRCAPQRPSWSRIAVIVALVVLSEALVVVWHHDQLWPRLVSAIALAGAFVVAGRWLRHRPHVGALMLAGSLAVGIVAVLVPQSAQPTHAMPNNRSAYEPIARPSRGGIVQINASANPRFTSERARGLLHGTMWELTGRPVLNGYTTAAPRAFYALFKNRYMGAFPPSALDRLLARERTTHRRWVDLLGLSTIILEKGRRWGAPPHGWHVAHRDAVRVIWIRDRPVPPAGGIVWTSPGTRVRDVTRGPLGVAFTVDRVPESGGSVVLSRIAWPGYDVSGARLGTPVHQVLLSVRFDGTAEGRQVSVRFRPPGWHAELASSGLAALLALGWTLGRVRQRRKRFAARPPHPDTVAP